MEIPMHRYIVRLTLVLAIVAAGCKSDGPTGTPNQDLNFLTPAPDAPALGLQTLTFNAVQGQDTEVFMWYRRRPERADSSELLRFRIRDRAQIVLPNGTALAPGQSVPITITIIDPQKLIVDMQPAGLRFTGDDEPANLTMWYIEQDDDFNDDGVVNSTDASIEQLLAIWRRENATRPWVKQTSRVVVESDEVEAVLHGFSNYVIAY
jgi:hypothetical protein